MEGENEKKSKIFGDVFTADRYFHHSDTGKSHDKRMSK